jgi:hypothetical protein
MSSNIERLQRISIRMRKICTFLMVAFPVSLVLDWSNLEFAAATMGMLDGLRFEAEFVGVENIALGMLINSILTTLAVLALYNLRKFFICNSEGNTFTSDAAMALHRFSKYLITYALAVVPVETAMGMAITMNHPEGERVLQASVSSEQLALIFLGFVFFACSWVLKESVFIAEENAQII